MAAVGGLLRGRLALVTGGGSGIGRAVCEALANRGASVSVIDLHGVGAKETSENLATHNDTTRHTHFAVNVASSSEVKDLLQAIHKEYQRAPCILVNSAGIAKDALLLKMKEQDFDDVIDVNLKGTFLMCQTTAKAMVENKINNGSIINISSIVAKSGNMGQANYAASKAGVEGLTKVCAIELARFGIRCNAILPGFIDTPMTRKVPAHITEQIKHFIPLGRFGQPSNIADVVSFLACDESSYITGASIDVTGGLSL
ncbi:predicted protein [Nematostella vectensis]|uniref:(3R)-3-hydroxyacyl-CoA dehydrogenase n=1 Tax=Nematostella vectensis TaxID=45351 RepID=A7RXH2_NEMVE|nr:estradiol 17-beta-dehydrogenase 8 isoform X1 [Nematostella vectensis]XP_048578399.1 estradiol 17-beta-dehydrogenase 8 isoform X2 [Nematostella vectensis]EDO43775.1 predicted protein [Nematostella vectensis]|eukprot:XP_001635838.1 predicted protein [Nematostella vectensis]